MVAELTGVPVELATVDGCGAPLFSTTLRGLARSFAALASGDGLPRRVGRAMSAHPWHVAGTGRDATRFMEAVPGLVAKDGADGVYAAGLPDGGAVALKIVDGSSRPRPAVLAAALAVAGVDPALVEAVALTPVLGHGRPVGEVVADLRRMRAVVQRVTRASVTVDGVVVGAIDRPGLVALVGVTPGDGAAQVELIARKIAELRILRDEQCAVDVGAPVLVVSQFTLYADTRKGRRPTWNAAAPGPVAQPLVDAVVDALRARGLEVATGVFGADMAVELVNDGPVTILLESVPEA